MTRSLLALVAAIFATTACAQTTNLIPQSAIKPAFGFVRSSPCAAGNADNCGTNPPTYQTTPAMCGRVFSTSAGRNADNSTSKRGIRFLLPKLSTLLADGRNTAGATGAAAIGGRGRDGQCEISFVMGLPGPENYLRISVDGVAGEDKMTFIRAGAYHDAFNGDVVFPYTSPGVITFAWNGVSWLVKGASPNLAEQLQLGQIQAHGRGRLFRVNKDPDAIVGSTWWSVGTVVGNLAYCPHNGLATATHANGGPQLAIFPVDCVFFAPGVGISTEYITLRPYGLVVSGMSAGDSYPAGTAPNGETYSSGNYIRLTVGFTIGLATGNTVDIYNLKPTGSTKVNGRWIVKLINSTTIELHEEIIPASDTTSHIGPPSSLAAGDSLGTIAPGAHGYYLGLTGAGIGGGRVTTAPEGVEYEGTNRIRSIVGAAYRNASTYTNDDKNLAVASLFNPIENGCQSTTAADRTVTSTAFVEVNSDMRCFFVFLNRVSAKSRDDLGAIGDRVRWQISVGASNGTASNGCEFSVGFNGITAETVGGNPVVAGFVNPSGVTGGRQTVALSGLKGGLGDGRHYVTLLARAVTGGTCTINAATTMLNLFVMQ